MNESVHDFLVKFCFIIEKPFLHICTVVEFNAKLFNVKKHVFKLSRVTLPFSVQEAQALFSILLFFLLNKFKGDDDVNDKLLYCTFNMKIVSCQHDGIYQLKSYLLSIKSISSLLNTRPTYKLFNSICINITIFLSYFSFSIKWLILHSFWWRRDQR